MNINDFQTEEKTRLDSKCWTGKKIGNPKTKMKGGVRVNNCVPAESVAEGTNTGPTIKGNKIYYADHVVILDPAIYNSDPALYDEYVRDMAGEDLDPQGDAKYHKYELDRINNDGSWTVRKLKPKGVAESAESLAEWEARMKKLGYKITKDNKAGTYHAWQGTTHKGSHRTQGVAEGQLNEYLVRAGMPVKDVLALNLFQDTGPDGQEGMADDPRWNRLMKQYQPIANALKKQILTLGKNRRLSDAEAEAVEEVWYDGSDAYEDMEVEYLADYYNMQIETVEAIIAGELQDEIDEGSTEFAGDTEQDQELRNYAQDTADRAREQIKNKMFNTLPKPGEDEPVHEEHMNPEYDDEAGMAQGSLHTLQNAVAGLQDVIDSGDNLPEWCQEKISLAEDYLVTVWDYIQSEKAQGIDPEIEEMYHAMESLAEEMAHRNRVSVDRVWEQFEALPDNVLYETAAWRRKEGKSKTGGLNAKGVASYRRENPGSKLQTAVTTKPSKLKKGSKAAKRRKSFCARMSGVKGPMKKPNGKPTRKALALRKWNC